MSSINKLYEIDHVLSLYISALPRHDSTVQVSDTTGDDICIAVRKHIIIMILMGIQKNNFIPRSSYK
jgi:hypothetical protein